MTQQYFNLNAKKNPLKNEMMPGGTHSAFYNRKIIVLKNNNFAHSAIGYSPLPNAYRTIEA